MSNVRKRINEAKNIQVYKSLLNVLGSFCNEFPMSSADRLFQDLCDGGAKLLPKDKRALEILTCSVCQGVQKLLNLRFSDLDYCIKPVSKAGRRHEVAFWCREGNVYDKVIDLINFGGKSGKGFWSDASGNKVELLDKSDGGPSVC